MSATTISPAGAGMRKAGKTLAIIGGIILLLSVIAGVILAVTGFGRLAEAEGDYQTFSGTAVISAQAGQEIQLYVPEGEPAPTCTVTDPDGQAPADGPGLMSTTSYEGRTWTSFGGFTAGAAGDYDVDCGTSDVLAGPPVSLGGVFGGVGGILLGVFGGGLGLLLLVIGVILLLVGRSKAKQAA